MAKESGASRPQPTGSNASARPTPQARLRSRPGNERAADDLRRSVRKADGEAVRSPTDCILCDIVKQLANNARSKRRSLDRPSEVRRQQ